jgi:hypothetical protein
MPDNRDDSTKPAVFPLAGGIVVRIPFREYDRAAPLDAAFSD